MLMVEVVGLEPTRSEETRFTVWRANQLLNTSVLETRMRLLRALIKSQIGLYTIQTILILYNH